MFHRQKLHLHNHNLLNTFLSFTLIFKLDTFLLVSLKDNGVLSRWSRTFIEFTEFRKFRESEKSLRHGFSIRICSVKIVSVV